MPNLATVSAFVKVPASFLILSFAFASALFGAETPTPAPSLSVPPLEFKHTTLPNGLEVYSVEDHSTPTVAIQLWYHVGSKDDPKDRSGFAHLFEHMMFKGNEHLSRD